MEIYLLIAVILNVIADILVWREVKTMRIAHQVIMIDTNAMKVTMEQSNIGFQEFSQTLGPALKDHAKLTAKALGSAIGFYQGKAQKAAEGEIEGLQSTIEALGPLANLIGQGPSGTNNSGNGKFHI